MKQMDRIIGFLKTLEANGKLTGETQSLVLVSEADCLGGESAQKVKVNYRKCIVNGTCTNNGCGSRLFSGAEKK